MRFLYHVRPRNAAHISRLRFRGIVTTHICSSELGCKGCYETGLISSLKLGIPFINAFCTGLRELILEVGYDWQDWPQDVTFGERIRQAEFDEAFKSFLENGIRGLKTVRILTIVPVKNKYDSYRIGVNVKVAAPIIQWSKERAWNMDE